MKKNDILNEYLKSLREANVHDEDYIGSDGKLDDYKLVKYDIFEAIFNTELEYVDSEVKKVVCKALQDVVNENLTEQMINMEYDTLVCALTLNPEMDDHTLSS